MRYAASCPPPKLLVRRSTADAMVEHSALITQWINEGKLLPVNPEEKVLLYDVEDIRTLALELKHNSRRFQRA